MPRTSLAIIAFLTLIVLPTSTAHVPIIGEDNQELSNATVISDPTKSWAIYGELPKEGSTHYYRFDLEKDQELYASLLKSTRQEDLDFKPWLILMGPGVASEGEIPDEIAVPEGADILVIEGRQPSQATYEAFAPSSYYNLGEIRTGAPATGTYYIAVYEPDRGGRYSLAIGLSESFTFDEWILNPINVIEVYQWEGQSLLFILAPVVSTVAIGLVILVWGKRPQKRLGPIELTSVLAALIYLGSGASILYQTLLTLTLAPAGAEIAITLIFALIPIILGIATLRLVLGRSGFGVKKRAKLAILGVIALFAWTGFLIGPALAFAASLIPKRAANTR